MTNWLITGGAGFIGKNLIERLLKDSNNQIRVIDNLSQEESYQYIQWPYDLLTSLHSLNWQFQKTQLIQADIQEDLLALKVCEGADVIVHLAANTGVEPSIKKPAFDFNANVIGTFNYLEAARTHQIKRFVYASSGASVGEVNPPIHENIIAKPLSPYGASKLTGENYCSAYFHSFGLETVALRFSNVYGPLSKHKASVVAAFIKQYLNEQCITIFGDGSQTRDFIHVSDLTRAIVAAATKENVGGEVFQVASGVETSINQLIETLNKILTSKGKARTQVLHLPARLSDVKNNFADITKIITRLNWLPEYTLVQGLAETLEWFMLSENKSTQNIFEFA